MSIRLETFEIGRLHGGDDVRLEVKDNRLILVGENGSGKTTVINILYHFLARQWHKLADYRFSHIRAVLNGETIELTRPSLDHLARRRGVRRRFSRSMYRVIQEALSREDLNEVLEDRRRLQGIAHHLGVPPAAVYEVVEEMGHEQLELLGEEKQKTDRLAEIITEEVLYLPTYRRIEQDLKAVFPDMEQRTLHDWLSTRRRQRQGFLELVEFGMEDVKQDTARVLEELREGNRAGLRNLTTRFLADVIEGRAEMISSVDLGSVDPATLDSVFSRVDDATLPLPARQRLLEVFNRVGSDADLKIGERIAAHFLLGLLELHRHQQDSEKAIDQFVATCNRYLTRKQFVFDRSNLSLEIVLPGAPSDDEEKTITLRDLSSGEKQIVSLFSHVLLSGGSSFFILLDEPELSLSVPWQQTFLPDILDTGRATGLIAVTHSPFIYDNDLDQYSHSLEDFRVAR